jgi:hypothetical protein
VGEDCGRGYAAIGHHFKHNIVCLPEERVSERVLGIESNRAVKGDRRALGKRKMRLHVIPLENMSGTETK